MISWKTSLAWPVGHPTASAIDIADRTSARSASSTQVRQPGPRAEAARPHMGPGRRWVWDFRDELSPIIIWVLLLALGGRGMAEPGT